MYTVQCTFIALTLQVHGLGLDLGFVRVPKSDPKSTNRPLRPKQVSPRESPPVRPSPRCMPLLVINEKGVRVAGQGLPSSPSNLEMEAQSPARKK